MEDAEESAGRRWLRLPALLISTVFLLCGLGAIALAHQHRLPADFVALWAGAQLAANGDAASAYDIVRHQAVETQAVANPGKLPFGYPPSFLLFLLPFGLVPFWIAFGLWVVVTAALYAGAAWRIVDLRFAFAQAAAAANFIVGQNGFLTAAIFIRGTELLGRGPLLAGALLGLLSFKPQLAILLPVALLAGREWRAIAGALLSAVTLVAISLLLFGSDPYRGFFALLPQFSQWLSHSRWPWGEVASLFALLRYFGAPHLAALSVHALVAAAAAGVTAWAWARKLDQRVPILAAASLLVPPYLFTYDALLLTVPLAWMLREERGFVTAAVWLLSLLPLVSYFTPFPNTLPLAAMLALWALHRRRRAAAHQV